MGFNVCLSRYSVILYVVVVDSDSVIWRIVRPDKIIEAKAFFTRWPFMDTTGIGHCENLSMILNLCKKVGFTIYVFLCFFVVGRVACNMARISRCENVRPTEYTENNINSHNIAF